MNIEIICPLYNGSKYIESLVNSISKQKNVNLLASFFVLTDTKDNSEEILNKLNLNYVKIAKSEFSHSLTREYYAFKSKADIVVFITQDIVIESDLWLYNLTKDIASKEVAGTYSRQISKYNNIEKYTREFNYKSISRTVSKKDINELGLKCFFFSDAASAVNKEVFIKVNGYDNKDLPISEDMYLAYKLINSDYKIKYCADSIVYHSHNFSLKELYKRYKLTGKFFKQNSYLNNYGTNKSGGSLAKYIIKRAIQDKNIKVLFRFIPDMLVRFIGMKVGYYGK